MQLNAFSKIAYQIVPKCKYKLIGTDLNLTPLSEDCSGYFDERGVFIGHDKTDVSENRTIRGVLTGITKDNVMWLPEGAHSSGYATFTSDVNLPLAGSCTADFRSRWLLQESDGTQYQFKARKRRGCVYTYLLENMCGPICE